MAMTSWSVHWFRDMTRIGLGDAAPDGPSAHSNAIPRTPAPFHTRLRWPTAILQAPSDHEEGPAAAVAPQPNRRLASGQVRCGLHRTSCRSDGDRAAAKSWARGKSDRA